jgi:hypothetical protein
MKLAPDRPEHAVSPMKEEVDAVLVARISVNFGLAEGGFRQDVAFDVGDEAGALHGLDGGAGDLRIVSEGHVRWGRQ